MGIMLSANKPMPTEDASKKKKRDTTGKPRAPARPYKRLAGEVLDYRLKDLNKKLTVLRSKLILMEDRLEAHSNEQTLRVDEA
jgi:hypothetical protein